jgi:hypothetical protein
MGQAKQRKLLLGEEYGKIQAVEVQATTNKREFNKSRSARFLKRLEGKNCGIFGKKVKIDRYGVRT